MKTMKWTLLLAFFAIWACQEEQFSQEEVWKDSSSPSPRVERLRTIKRVDNAPATRAVGVKDKLWQPGDTIRIKFQNADEYPGMSDKVIQYAAIWLQYAYLHFEYVDKEEEADVKIGFNMDDRWLSWSTLGTDCKSIDQDSVSANFVWLENDDEETIQGEVLRTFGHILGLGFEHQSPASPITLNDVKTIDYYINNFNLTDSTIINDILPYYNSDQTNYTEFDDESIMTLELPGRQTQDRPYYNLYFNYTLSPTDIAFVRDSLYPTPPRMDCLMEITTDIIGYVNFDFIIQADIIIESENGEKQFYQYDSTEFHNKKINFTPIFIPNKKQTIHIYGSDIAITDFILQSPFIPSIIVYSNKALKNFSCSKCNFTSIDMSKCPELEELSLSGDSLKYINLRQNPKLTNLVLENNQLTSIDISYNKDLKYIICSNNQLTKLDVSNNPNLTDIKCNHCRLPEIDLSHNPNLSSLFASYNKFTSLDVTENKKLINLTVDSNLISNIKFSQHKDLIFLKCQKNQMTSLNVSQLTNLRVLYCYDNPLSLQELENIANNICYCTDLEGGVVYNPLNDSVSNIFKSKNWYVHTDIHSAPLKTSLQWMNYLGAGIPFKAFRE